MPHGGVLRIETSTTHLDDEGAHHVITLRAGDYVVLRVSDTGIGMDQETLSHLFEPFLTTKEKGRGTGLGLSTSYGIVKQNHGEIIVHSVPGVGTTFVIYLPLVRDPVEPSLARDGNSKSYGGAETVLVAEDEDGVRTVMTDMLRKQGYTVVAAPSGADALEAASHMDQIDLLVTDIVMPKMSGGELARLLKGQRAGLRILFVSGYTEGAIGRSTDLEPGTGFLHKPFTPEDLARKVRELLDQPVAAPQPGD
jgi:CheY-like chemotaxis protein